MRRRSLLYAPLLAAQPPVPAATPVVWILAEAHGWHLGALGTAGLHTPCLDQLAEQGTLYTRAYAAPLAIETAVQGATPQATYTATLEALKKRPSSLVVALDRAATFANARPAVSENAIELPPSLPDLPIVRSAWARYLNYIQCLDALTGAVLAAIDRAGLAEETRTIYLSKQGPTGRRSLCDLALRVPVLMRGPGVPANVRRHELVSLADLPKPDARQVVAFENAEGRTVFDGRFRYIRNRAVGKSPLPAGWEEVQAKFPAHWRWLTAPIAAEELYDHAADPPELHNVAADLAYRDHLSRLAKLA